MGQLVASLMHSPERSPINTAQDPRIYPIFEATTGTFQYIVTDPSSSASVIIDPVLDFDPCTSTISTTSADALLTLISKEYLNIHYILETHAHADHISAASYLQAQLSKTETRPQIGIGARIDAVQKLFGARYGVPPAEYSIAFDRLFSDDELLTVGGMHITAMHLPGHTPDHMGYRIGANVFCGDSLFHADIGTARTDFPGGSARALWASAQKLLALPDETRIWTGHDYPPEGARAPVAVMTVRQHREENRHVGVDRGEEEFVNIRMQRDKALGAPRLLHQSLQVNVRGGRLPAADEDGRRMLRVPLKLHGAENW
ncbi:hypothetical protein G6514_006974 [Epicoccum nigrum]|nr:hypothetical protein G6514_006974 [Epicoccum nigrum]